MVYKSLRDSILPSVLTWLEEKQKQKEQLAIHKEEEEKKEEKRIKRQKRESEMLVSWDQAEVDAIQAEADRGTRLALRQAKMRTKEMQELEAQLYSSDDEKSEKSVQSEGEEEYVLPERRRNSIKVDDWYFSCPCGIQEMNYDGISFLISYPDSNRKTEPRSSHAANVIHGRILHVSSRN